MKAERFYAIIEADHHIQNPLSKDKLKRVVDYLRLADGERVVDVGCGKGSLLLAMAQAYRIEAVGLESNPVFAAVARKAADGGGLTGSARIVEGPALDFDVAVGSLDVAACIGATFALGGLEPSLDWLAQAVRPGGRIAVGEPFALGEWTPDVRQRWPEYDRTLPDIVLAFERRHLNLTGIVATSIEDWDHYESQHWRAAAAWLRANPDDPDAAWLAQKIAADRAEYLAQERDCFGWAVFVAEKSSDVA
jgi:cyclopropane fatty-acyl-phospholipid synthase-like methyltransferase